MWHSSSFAGRRCVETRVSCVVVVGVTAGYIVAVAEKVRDVWQGNIESIVVDQ